MTLWFITTYLMASYGLLSFVKNIKHKKGN